MKIASAAVQMDASHLKTQHYELKESLRAWVGGRRPDFEGDGRASAAAQAPVPQVRLSDAGRTAQSSESNAIRKGLDAADKDPVLSLIRAMITLLSGHEVKVFDASELRNSAAPLDIEAPARPGDEPPAESPSAGYGIEYDRHESYSETEATHFSATGRVRTTDGKEINFSLELSMARSYHEESDTSLRLGDARQKKDPLVLNFNGSAAQLTSQRFKFDLDADGRAEDINFVAGGSGFLALDRNGDGKINDGSELFGARSGDGFAELSALDADHNGWIDENDAAYDQLRVWTKNSDGKDGLETLRQANVGALNLARVATPFDLMDGQNAMQGQVRATGIFLQENGKAGTMQQIDLTV